MKRCIAVLPLALILAACAGGPSGGGAPEPPAPPPGPDPVGVWDCYLDVEGMELLATLSITGTPGEYEGAVTSDMGTMAVRDITLEGDEMTFVVDAPDMTVFFAVVMEGDTFEGDFDAGGMGGYITGKRR